MLLCLSFYNPVWIRQKCDAARSKLIVKNVYEFCKYCWDVSQILKYHIIFYSGSRKGNTHVLGNCYEVFCIFLGEVYIYKVTIILIYCG